MDVLFKKLKQSKQFQEDINKLDKQTLNLIDLSPLKNETRTT